MRRFRFRLESTLRLRGHELDRRRAELSGAEEKLRYAESLRRGCEIRAAEAGAWLDRRAAAGLSPVQIEASKRGLTVLYAELRRAEQAAEQARARAEAARQAAGEARTRVRALEVLRQRALEAHRVQERRREQAELDEVAARCAGGAP